MCPNNPNDRPSDWDARHQAAADREPAPEAASFVRELLPLLPRGPALDLACGAGRHAMLLAGRQPVTAVDRSAVGLDLLEERARASGLYVRRAGLAETLAASRYGIDLVEADLERVCLPEASFTLILCVQYLQRSLFGQIARALAPGGMVLFETYTRAQLEFADGPKNPEHLLEHGELRVAFPTLRLLFYRELRARKGIASLIALKPFVASHSSAE